MPMRTSIMRNSAGALALAATTLAAAPAFADQAKIKSMSFNTESANTTIHVISTDGQQWDELKSGNVQFWGHMKLDTKWPGYVGEVGVALGVCGAQQCQTFPMIWSDLANSRDYNHQRNFTFSTSKIPVSNGGIPIIPYGDQMINKCNQHLQPDGPTKSYSFTQTFNATFVAETDKILNMNNVVTEANAGDWPFPVNYATHSEHGEFQVQVVCDPVIKPPTNDVAANFGEFDVENVKLFLTTYASIQQGSNPGSVCPKLKVTSRAETNQAGPVSMRIWRQKNGGPITNEFKQAWASFDAAKNGYFATYETWEDVGATSHFQFKTEIEDGTAFPPFDGWKDIMVHCSGAGGGGLIPLPPLDPDNPPAQPEWDGEVTVLDSAGYDKSCPRKGQVSFEVSREEPGAFDYRISCSNGAFFTGTAYGFEQGGVFMASGSHELNITKTRTIQCTLQEKKANGTWVTVDKDDEGFTCIKRTFDPQADDLTIDTRPDFNDPRPTLPPVVVNPGVKCLASQKLVRGKCVDKPLVVACRKGERVLNGKCVKIPGVSIHCLPGYVQKGKVCVKKPVIAVACKRGEQRINGMCVKKPEVSILCKPGFKLVGKKCVRIPTLTKVCGKKEKLVRGNCVPKQPAVRTLTIKKAKPDARRSLPTKAKKKRIRVN
jgi:hypothetical protein